MAECTGDYTGTARNGTELESRVSSNRKLTLLPRPHRLAEQELAQIHGM